MNIESRLLPLIDRIRDANPDRSLTTLRRRVSKLLEEVGELSEAWLNVTSATNGKEKTWDDVREEAADCLIVAVDVHLTGIMLEPAPIHLFARRGETEHFQSLTFSFAHQASGIGCGLNAEDLQMASFYAAQTAITAIDLCLTPMPDQASISDEDLFTALDETVTRKLHKWTSSRASRVSEDAKADDAV